MAPEKPTLSRRAFLRRSVRAVSTTAGAALAAGCPADSEYVAIAGSGITGLCAGALLSKLGFRVHVLEADPDHIGGNAAGLVMEGFHFSAGPQYVWSFRDEGLGARVMAFLGLEESVPFDSMDPDGYDEYRLGDVLMARVPLGFDRHEDVCHELFPHDNAGIRTFFSFLRDLYAAAQVIERTGTYRCGAGAMLSSILDADDISGRVKARAAQCASWSLSRLFDACRLSLPTRQFLYGNSGLFLERATDVWALVYAAAAGSYHSGPDFPRFGFASLVDGLVGVITGAGGLVETNKKVSALHLSGGKIVEVQCADGTAIPVDRVISTLSPRLTHALLDHAPIWRAAYLPSPSATGVFVGVRDYRDLPELFGGRNIWWSDMAHEPDFLTADMTTPPRVMNLTSESARGIYNPHLDTSMHSLAIFTPGNLHQAQMVYDAGIPAYDELRASIADRVLDVVEAQILPGLRGKVEFIDVQTPVDIQIRTGAESASIYGRRLTPENLLRRPYDLYGITNLHIACATAGLPGIAPAFRTASVLVESLTGLSL